MIVTLIIVSIIYISALVFLSVKSRQKETNTNSYFLAGSNLGSVLGLFTFAATLFSTFTLIGMPDFFREHGVGSWIFLAVSDTVMVFGIVVIGVYFRKKALSGNFKGMSGVLSQCYQNKLAGYIVFIGYFIFLTPYVAIQIRGIAIFLLATFPQALPMWGWALKSIGILLVYSELGGLKAIIYSDTLQAILLLVIIWLIAGTCLYKLGGINQMMVKIEKVNPALLSTPGPKNHFSFQFMLASMLAIMMIPFTQPQVSTRLVIMRSNKAMFRMAIGVGVFAMLVIFPTFLIGMYGAVLYPSLNTADFISKALIQDQTLVVGALAIIGLIAAAISTADSQLFALGGELHSLLTGKNDKKMLLISRLAIVGFATITFVFSLMASDELVLLARTSFAGTAMMTPMIFTGVFSRGKAPILLPLITFLSIMFFILSLVKLVPEFYFGVRLDLLLFALMALLAIILRILENKQSPEFSFETYEK